MRPNNPLPLSVCLISGNEAKRISRALESVSGWASETIVVLNDDVSDSTEQIALAAGAKVFRESWAGYVAQKNSAAAKCTQPWLLNIDADEEVTPALQMDIERVIADPSPPAAFRIPRCTRFCGRWIRHGDWYPDFQTRLWQQGQARWVGGSIHETLATDGAVGKLYTDLLHHTSDSIDNYIGKIPRYSDEFATDSAAHGHSPPSLDLLVRPAWRFFRGYFLRRGILDGWQGIYIAWLTAFYTATRYAKAINSQAP